MFGHGRHHGGHHHSHHHRHHGSGLGAVILGGLALGAVAAVASPPRRQYAPVYVATPAPVIVRTETPEEAAARIHAQQLREEVRQRELERHRLEAERQRAELIKQRLEKERLENEAENIRIENYKAHLELTKGALSLAYDALSERVMTLPALQDPIYRFHNSIYKDIPEEKSQNKNLFGCVLFNPYIYDNTKRELLETLITQKGYERFAIKLFNEPLFSPMYNNIGCFELMGSLYNNKFVNSNLLPLETERLIWRKLISLNRNNGPALFNSIGDRNKKLQLLTDWINDQPRATDVLDVFKIINSRQINLNSDANLNALNKIAKQRILQIELAQNSVVHQGEDNERIRNFKNTHRDALSRCVSCLFSPRSMRISHLIYNGNNGRALQEWEVEDANIHEQFYRPRNIK